MLNPTKISVKSPFTWIFLAGSLLFFGGWLMLKPGSIHHKPFTSEDALGYLEAGKSLWLNFQLHGYRTFGYAIFTGLPFGFGADEILTRYILVILNGSFYILSGLLLYDIIEKIIGFKAIALACALVFLFSPGIIFANYVTLSEPLFIFCLLLALRFLVVFEKTRDPEDLLWLALSLLFSAAINPFNIWFSIFISVSAVFIFIRFRMGLRNLFLLCIGIFLMLILPMLGMEKTHGVFTFSHSIKHTLYHYTCSRAAGLPNINKENMYDSFQKMEQRVVDSSMETNTENWAIRDSLYSATFTSTLNQDKSALFQTWIGNMTENATAFSLLIPLSQVKPVFNSLAKSFINYSQLQNIIFNIMGLILVFYLAFVFIYKLIKKRALKDLTISIYLAFLLLSLTGMNALSYGQGDRLSMVIYPFVLILICHLFFRNNINHSQNITE